MNYEIIKLACSALTDLEKMKLAQFLIQTSIHAIEQEQEQEQAGNKPQDKESTSSQKENKKIEAIQSRIMKSKPTKVSSMKNFIRSMFQHEGGISESEMNNIFKYFKKAKVFKISGEKIVYL
ncbi:hypothetical protein [Photobacterium kishitanii]|uniref:Uncharacterized protein n=1 Tax=Photobacterium kishitanii TaxID=318456 RepID=A0A2T3KM78_9GAMM|nr:hypothetical protein [Photobacterium kishitanii]PSV00884.1 hypothetical protein C9J27_02325 [Photobacterium kishitanii]